MEPETRYQRVAREQRERAEKRAALLKLARKKPRKRANKHRSKETYEDRLDDLGESPDY